jgi:hypothetical protein
MAKEKTEFEIRANTLKAMAKQCTAKVKNNRAALMAVFIDRMSENAYASDGYKVAILDMYGHMDPAEINELAFYADMQAIEFSNGFALISAKKKETFVKNFGNGLADADTERFDYPDMLKILPKVDNLQHASNTHANFLPSNLVAIDKIVTAAEQNTVCSVTERLYGERENSIHIAFYKGLLVGLLPYKTPQEFLEEIPSRGHYFNAIRTAPNADPCESFDDTESDESNEDSDE